jgi:hypothetical protein
MASQLRNQEGGAFEKFAHFDGNPATVKTAADPAVMDRAKLITHFDKEPMAKAYVDGIEDGPNTAASVTISAKNQSDMVASMHHGFAMRHLTPMRAMAAVASRRNSMDEVDLFVLMKARFDQSEDE